MRSGIAFLLLLHAASLSAQDNLLATAEAWTISPNGGRIADAGGEPVLQLTGGAAQLSGLTFESGTIAFEMRLTPRPAFVGLRFRAQDDASEHVYFRPHRSGFWDAIQYQPVMHSSTTWQLYQIDGFSQSVDLPPNEWIPVRLDVRGSWADLYVGQTREPTMRITLERSVISGGIAFTAGFRDGNPNRETAGAFRRLRVTPQPSGNHSRPEEPEPDDDLIRTWAISEPFAVNALPITELRPSQATRTIRAERHGVINLNRHYSKVPDATRSAVLAAVTIDADRATRIPLALDFSDDVSVFLNGNLEFSGVNGWQSRYPYYLGGLRPDALTNTVWLDLRQGTNRLSLVVSDEAFGWGFVAELPATPGVRVRAR